MKLGVVLIYAEDFEAMVSFYRDDLGLEAVEIDPGDEYEEGVDFTFFDAGGAGVEIFDRAVHPPDLPSSTGGAVRAGFQADDLDAARSRLIARGIAVGARRGHGLGGATQSWPTPRATLSSSST